MRDSYENQLLNRYASREMQEVFSDAMRFRTWRRLWLALAESEQELGLAISDAQLTQLRNHLDEINYGFAAIKERELRHNVRAHLHAFGMQCPLARPILHLGVSDAYVTENGELIRLRAALRRIRRLLLNTIAALADFAERYRRLPCTAYRGFQAAEATTLGKRATLWIADLLLDLRQLDFRLGELRLLGCRDTTGNAAALLKLFDGNCGKVQELERRLAEKLGFAGCYPVSGQCYSRKVDVQALSVLGGVAVSVAKFANDMRLLCHTGEICEPPPQQGQETAERDTFACSERIAALSRFVLANAEHTAQDATSQWLESALIDYGEGRLSAPSMFLAVEAMLNLYIYCIEGCEVHPYIIAHHLAEELPFMALGEILHHCLGRGGARQPMQKALLKHAQEAADKRRVHGGNDLLQRIAADPLFGIGLDELRQVVRGINYTGCAVAQTEAFLSQTVDPLLAENQRLLGLEIKIEV